MDCGDSDYKKEKEEEGGDCFEDDDRGSGGFVFPEELDESLPGCDKIADDQAYKVECSYYCFE